MNEMLWVSSSPHIKDRETTTSIMVKVVIALLPALIAGGILLGLRAVAVSLVCVAACVLFEYLYCKAAKKRNTVTDCSAVVTGLLLAFSLPPSIPIWMAVVGSFVAIVVVKQLFGGIGQNFANPAVTARIVLLLSFTQYMTNWTSTGMVAVTGATPLPALQSGNTEGMPSYLEMFLGLRGGCIGEICGVALLLGGIFLMVTKVISPVAPVACIASTAVMALLLGSDPLYHILSGGLLLGAFFMVTDYTTTPSSTIGRAIFGVGVGVLTVVMRMYSRSPEGLSYAILLMNIVTPLIDRGIRQKPFGAITTKGGKAS